METIDEKITKASLDYLERAKKADKPFFLWWNSTRMHVFTHLKKEREGKTGLGISPDGMVEHDAMVGQLLDKLKELGLFLLVPAQGYVGQFLGTFWEFPPSQKIGTFSLEKVLESLQQDGN